jgi:hypothetical protein
MFMTELKMIMGGNLRSGADSLDRIRVNSKGRRV